MTTLWLDLAALLLYGPIVVLIHEAGHAAFARRGGYRVTDFAIGMGRPIWRIDLRGGAVLHIDRLLLLGGACTAIPIEPPSSRRAWFHLGGLLFQAILMVLLLPLIDSRWGMHAITFNGLVMVHNAIPWRMGHHASDGWHLWDALTGARRGADVLAQRAAIERMLARAEQVGTPLGVSYARVCVAWATVLAGRPEDANALFRDDPPATTVEPWVDALYHYVCAEWHRAHGRPLAALRTAREAYNALDLETVVEGQALIALSEARALAELGAPAQAQRALARMAGTGGAIGWQAAVTQLWASLSADPDDLELATRRLVLRLHHTGLDPGDGAMALWEAGHRLAGHGRIGAARHARSAATNLARRVLRRAPDTDRTTLAARMGQVAGATAPEWAASSI
jgi:hypothetical protein